MRFPSRELHFVPVGGPEAVFLTSPVSLSGVEPEPFEMGEHLVEASGKLCLLDSMLAYLHKGLVHPLMFGLHLLVTEAYVFFPSLWLGKRPPGAVVHSDDEDAGHSSGLHGIQR